MPFLTLSTRRTFRRTGVTLGDYAVVLAPRTGRLCLAVVGDSSDLPSIQPSPFIAEALGTREAPDRLIYLVFPGSGLGQGTIPTLEQIQRRGARLFNRGVVPSFGPDAAPRSDAAMAPHWNLILADAFGEVLKTAAPVDRTLRIARLAPA